MRVIDIIGTKFTRWLVISRASNDAVGKAQFLCRCDCGAEKVLQGILLRRGVSKSCGCLKLEALSKRQKTHGHTANGKPSPTFHSWAGMIARCTNPNNAHYKYYGGVGISVCDRWHSFSNFLQDMGEKPPRMSIDRIDVSGNYEPSNCRWATAKEQARNKTNNTMLTANGETLCLAAWAERLGINQMSLSHRINNGWSHEDAINTPIAKTAKEAARKSQRARILTYKGQTKCVTEWAEETGIPRAIIYRKLQSGKTAAEIFT